MIKNVMANLNVLDPPKLVKAEDYISDQAAFYEDQMSLTGFYNQGHITTSFIVNNESILKLFLITAITYTIAYLIVKIYSKDKSKKLDEKSLNCVIK